jgi:hypothetical protein
MKMSIQTKFFVKVYRAHCGALEWIRNWRVNNNGSAFVAMGFTQQQAQGTSLALSPPVTVLAVINYHKRFVD